MSSIYDPFMSNFPSVDPSTDPAGYAQQAFGPDLIKNGNFAQNQTNPPGTWSTGNMPGWNWTGPAPEVIHGPYGGDPAHHISPLGSGFFFDSEASPGNTKIFQTIQPLPLAAGVHETIQVAFENIGGQTTSIHDVLHVTLGNASLDISVNDFKDAQGHIDYNHTHQFTLDTYAFNPLDPSSILHPAPIVTTIQEIGPDAAHGNVGFAVTGVSAHSDLIPFLTV